MGHYIEYVIKAAPEKVAAWLSSLDGYFDEDELPLYWEGDSQVELSFLAEITSNATLLTLPIKGTWLFVGDPQTVQEVGRFESWLLNELAELPILRVDEIVRILWEKDIGREWHQVQDPYHSLCEWVAQSQDDHSSHFRILVGEPPGC